jgi:hypothetical protein
LRVVSATATILAIQTNQVRGCMISGQR